MVIVITSGGFDPLHVGHIELFKEALKCGEHYSIFSHRTFLAVILNTDEWLMRKKGYVFMPFNERRKILEAIRYVGEVVPCIDEDDTVCETIRMVNHENRFWGPTIFAKGGDRTAENTPEQIVCKKLGIQVVFGLGNKIQSSSELVRRANGKVPK